MQGLTTNDISILSNKQVHSIYTNILNVQGRVAFDALVSPFPPSTSNTNTSYSYLIDCSAMVAPLIQQYFTKYKLRNKINIRDISDKYRVWTVYGKDIAYVTQQAEVTSSLSHSPSYALDPLEGITPFKVYSVVGSLEKLWNTFNRDTGVLAVDPRYSELGLRLVLPLDHSRE